MHLFKPKYRDRHGNYVEATTYAVRFTENGKRVVKSLGTANKANAEAKARALLRKSKEIGWEVLKPKLPGRTKATIEDIIEAYSEHAKTGGPKGRALAPRTVRANVGALRRIAADVEAATVADMMGKIDGWKKAHAANAVTTDVTLRLARSIFAKKALVRYLEKGHAVENPFAGVALANPTIAPFAGFEMARIEKLIAAAKAQLRDADRDAYVIFLLTLCAGLRAQEATWAQKVHLTDSSIIVVSDPATHETKARRPRPVPLAPSIVAELRAVASPDGPYLVGAQRATLKRHEIRGEKPLRRLAEWLRGQGITDRKPVHFLRKAYGAAVATRISAFAAQKYLGHSTMAVTEAHYSALIEKPSLDLLNGGVVVGDGAKKAPGKRKPRKQRRGA